MVSGSIQVVLNGNSLDSASNISQMLTKIRRNKTKRILKQKLVKKVLGENIEGNSPIKPINMD